MDYAYQKNYGSTWNDFDGTKYRDQNFTYPMSNGILSTIQWEGFREGIDDVRYISTLLNKIDNLRASGLDVSGMQDWVNSLDPAGNLDNLRNTIIDRLLLLNDIYIPAVKTPEIIEIVFIDSTLLKIRFNKCLDPSTISAESFIINPTLQILSFKLSTDLSTLFLKTSPHNPYFKYKIVLNNVTDLYKNQTGNNPFEYSAIALQINIKVFLQGPYLNGSMKSLLNPELPLKQPFNKEPWEYNYEDQINKMPVDIVDWVLIELRSEPNIIVYRKAGLLRTDGYIIDPDGSIPLKFYNIEPGNYYISVKHRNHLGVISSAKWPISTTSQLLDLTTNLNVSPKCSMIKLNESSYGLISGDCDANGKVEVIDFKTIKQQLNDTGYNLGDLNLDGIVNEIDYMNVKKSLLKYSSFK